MIAIVQHATNLWMRIFPAWNKYFAYSRAAWKLENAAVHIYEGFTSSAAYASRGSLTPPQAEAVAILIKLSGECMKDGQRSMKPITREELNG